MVCITNRPMVYTPPDTEKVMYLLGIVNRCLREKSWREDLLIKYLLFHKYDDGTRSSGIVFGPYDVLTVLNLGVCLGIETVTPHEDDRAPVRMYRLNPNDLKKDPNDIPELAKSLQNHV